MASTYDIDDFAATRLSLAVVEAVAKEEGVSQLDLPPLGDTVDPLLLDRVLQVDDSVSVSISYNGYDIKVNSTGEILIS